MRTVATAILAILLPIQGHASGCPQPDRWQRVLDSFAEDDAAVRPPPGAVVATGSSSIRLWHNTIGSDLAPLTIVAKGFGGSVLNDVLCHVDTLVNQYRPRAVLLYEGDNDIACGTTPESLLDTFRAVVDKIHAADPRVRVYALSIKPSLARWSLWPVMKRANALLDAECASDARLHYVDVAAPMLNEKGEPKPEIFMKDGLHMNAEGYRVWTAAVRPALLAGNALVSTYER